MNEVVVTGIGTVTAAGTDLGDFWDWLVAPTDGPVRGAVTGFDPSRWMTAKDRRRSDPFARYAVAAAHLAHQDAGAPAVEPRRTGVVLGAVYGALETLDAERAVLDREGPEAVSPFLSVLACENAPVSEVARAFGARGPAKAVVSACASGTHAVGDGFDLVRSGRCDLVLAGATQGAVTGVLRRSFENLRVLSPTGFLRPFDRRRDGFAFAEGAVVLVLEAADAARRRGAQSYAEVLGAANTNDADSMVSPSGQGAVECMRAALADAGVGPGDIGHVNAHGTGTAMNDRVESASLHEVFGSHPPPVTSTKGVTGHAAGASGAFEAAAAALTLHHRLLPPLAPDHQPDPDIPLELVTGGTRPWEPGPLLSNSFGLGGHNGCLIFGPA